MENLATGIDAGIIDGILKNERLLNLDEMARQERNGGGYDAP